MPLQAPGGLMFSPGLLAGPGRMGRAKIQGPNPDGPLSQTQYLLTGTTRDAGSNPLPNCAVHVFLTATDQELAVTMSDASGIYSVFLNTKGPVYVVAYLPGSPDVTGATVNTLVPVG